MKFNEKLKMLREEKEMTITDFAKMLGTSKQVISRYERGDNTPKITTVMQYAEILGVSLDFLVNDDIDDPHYAKVKRQLTESELSESKSKLIELVKNLSEEDCKAVLRLLDRK